MARPPDYITIPRSEYEGLVSEVRRGVEVCQEVSNLRIALQTFSKNLKSADKTLLKETRDAVDSCEEVSRLRVELSALERRLREFDQELTPIRPPSRTDIQAAFDNANDFASGKRKPPGA